MHDTFEEIFENMGGIVLEKSGADKDFGLHTPGGSSTKWGLPVWAAIPKLRWSTNLNVYTM